LLKHRAKLNLNKFRNQKNNKK